MSTHSHSPVLPNETPREYAERTGYKVTSNAEWNAIIEASASPSPSPSATHTCTHCGCHNGQGQGMITTENLLSMESALSDPANDGQVVVIATHLIRTGNERVGNTYAAQVAPNEYRLADSVYAQRRHPGSRVYMGSDGPSLLIHGNLSTAVYDGLMRAERDRASRDADYNAAIVLAEGRLHISADGDQHAHRFEATRMQLASLADLQLVHPEEG